MCLYHMAKLTFSSDQFLLFIGSNSGREIPCFIRKEMKIIKTKNYA